MSDKKQPFLSSQFGGGRDNCSYDSIEAAYNWPNLLDESKEMLEGAILIYALADLRSLARSKKLSQADETRLMTLPLTPSDVMEVVRDNIEQLKANFGETGADFYLNSFSSVHKSLRKQEVDAETGEAVFASSNVVVFDDEKEFEEMVYGIAINTARKRITVGFRGSVTVADFLADANSILAQIDNPIEGAKEHIFVHSGFRDYYYGKRTKDGGSKHDKIMNEVVDLMNQPQYADFKLYSCGHSLGGALCTLFAFEAAADPRIRKPVSCINIASPKVGNLSFRRAFSSLEESGVLRCLRIANYKDLVTLLPDRGSVSCLYILCCQSNVYRHVGMELKLYSPSLFKFFKPPTSHNTYMSTFLRDYKRQIINVFYVIGNLPVVFCCGSDFLRYHGCDEYMARLEGNASNLQQQALCDLYKQKDSLIECE